MLKSKCALWLALVVVAMKVEQFQQISVYYVVIMNKYNLVPRF